MKTHTHSAPHVFFARQSLMLQKRLLHEKSSHQSNDGLQAHTEPALNVLNGRLQVCEDLDERPRALQGHLSYSK